MNIFEKACRLKLRFETDKGLLSVEELFDLPLRDSAGKRMNLDDIARQLFRQLKFDEDVSFVVTENKSDSIIQLKFDIVKYIIDIRLAENDARLKEQENKQQKERILGILAQRQDEELKNKSVEELNELLKNM